MVNLETFFVAIFPLKTKDHDEEALEGTSQIAWRRVATFIHLPAITASGATQQMVPIEPALLQASLELDERQS
ncbi:hypothetical protein X743_11775 [Mesorhizobium sp. LNHC252B00]|uniref:hypothetical protein n=1 Tax=Mesorhizobium sp. LNHC252B00 TaxID=1287252 RepID=UPI0003CF1402|nr:hypothetical protein [Mesorhizobium sp. LNHC252B00]ESY73581.1 hypothetical protein X743_11775 [Mesorhizobium sp. LNHC252B00]